MSYSLDMGKKDLNTHHISSGPVRDSNVKVKTVYYKQELSIWLTPHHISPGMEQKNHVRPPFDNLPHSKIATSEGT